MCAYPRDEWLPRQLAGCQCQHYALGVLDSGVELVAVEQQHRLERGVAYPLVAVHEGVIADEREAQRRGLVGQRGIQVHTGETGPRLRDRRLKRPQVTNADRAACLLNDGGVEGEDLRERQVPHAGARPLGEPLVERAVLREDVLGGRLEVGLPLGEEIPEGGGGELLRGDAEALGHSGELRLEGAGEFDGELHG